MLGLARGVDSFGASLMIILLPLYVEHFEVSFSGLPTATIIGILLSVYGFTNTSIQPAVGIMVDRIGHTKFFISLGLLLYAMSTIGFIWLTNFFGLAMLRIFQGIGVALTIPTSMTLITEYTEARTRGSAMSFYNVMRLLGFSTGPIVGGYLLTIYDFPPILVLAASAGIIGAILVQFLVRNVERPTNKPTTIGNDIGAYFDSSMIDFYKLAFANVTMALAISLVAPLENEFNARLNQTSADFGVAFSALILTLMIVQIPIGRLADKFGRKQLIVIGLLLLIPPTIWMGYVTTTFQFILARMFQGISVACVAAPSFALGGDKSSRNKRGKEMSLLTMAFGFGIAVGPIVAGFLSGYFTFEAPFWVGGTLLSISAGLVGLSVSGSSFFEENS